jgi:hypothetical protein
MSIWCSIATSFNYVSPSHQDKIVFLSCLMVSFSPQDGNFDKFMCNGEMAIAVYFCLPEYKLAIALCPGNVIFFNRLHHHCISQRTGEYLDEEVYVSSFYMKAGQLGGNDSRGEISRISNLNID